MPVIPEFQRQFISQQINAPAVDTSAISITQALGGVAETAVSVLGAKRAAEEKKLAAEQAEEARKQLKLQTANEAADIALGQAETQLEFDAVANQSFEQNRANPNPLKNASELNKELLKIADEKSDAFEGTELGKLTLKQTLIRQAGQASSNLQKKLTAQQPVAAFNKLNVALVSHNDVVESVGINEGAEGFERVVQEVQRFNDTLAGYELVLSPEQFQKVKKEGPEGIWNTYIYSMIQTPKHTAGVLGMLNNDVFNKVLTTKELSQAKSAAGTAFKQADQTAKNNRIGTFAQASTDQFNQFLDNKLSPAQIDTMVENKLVDKELGEFMKERILKGKPKEKKPFSGTRANSYMELLDRQQAILKIKKKKGKVKGTKSVEEYIRYLRDVAKSEDDPDGITREEAKTLTKAINEPYFKAVRSEKGSTFFGADSPYDEGFDAINEYLESNDINRKTDVGFVRDIMVEFINIGDQNNLLEIEDPEERDKAIRSASNLAINRVARRQNPSLRMIEGTPNNVISNDIVTPVSKESDIPSSEIEATGQRRFELFKDANGNFAKKFPDGSFQPLTKEEGNRIINSGATK